MSDWSSLYYHQNFQKNTILMANEENHKHDSSTRYLFISWACVSVPQIQSKGSLTQPRRSLISSRSQVLMWSYQDNLICTFQWILVFLHHPNVSDRFDIMYKAKLSFRVLQQLRICQSGHEMESDLQVKSYKVWSIWSIWTIMKQTIKTIFFSVNINELLL